MIRRYLDFINENQIKGFNSLGEWIESLVDDEYVRNIVSRYTNEVDSSVNLANAINILDDNEKKEIKQQVDEYLEHGIEEKEPQFLMSTDLEPLTESEANIAGKGIFNSFLKALTALGQKESNPAWEKSPQDFVIFYYYPNLQSEIVKQIFSRFKSLERYIDLIDYQKNETNLYFGIKSNGLFEYGFFYEQILPIGQFKVSQSVIKWICQLEWKSAFSLKKELVNLSYSDILTLGQIKSDMKDFNPGYYEKKLNPLIKDRVISFGYFGVGRWDNGKLDEGELQNIKTNFTNYLLSKKWGSKVLISIKPQSFWIYLNIKLK